MLWYGYVNNNPVNFVDPLGLSKDNRLALLNGAGLSPETLRSIFYNDLFVDEEPSGLVWINFDSNYEIILGKKSASNIYPDIKSWFERSRPGDLYNLWYRNSNGYWDKVYIGNVTGKSAREMGSMLRNLGSPALLSEEPVKTVWPTSGRVSSYVGDPNYPIFDEEGNRKFHRGMDIGNVIGTPIIAPFSGTITNIYNNDGDAGFGVEITSDNGTMVARFFHFDEASLWSIRDKVQIGQQVGFLGNTGLSTGPHLHFEIFLNGVLVDVRSLICNKEIGEWITVGSVE
jgi:murein DD-endopeptidase MepM/ murein hydrolase activator NlpD